MTNKLGLIVSMALAALAFAIPVSAASAEWTHDGGPLSGNAAVEFSGPMSWNLVGTSSGADAIVHIEATLIGGTTEAEVTGFESTECKGTGSLAGLVCTDKPIGLPWPAHIDGDDIVIEEVELDTPFYKPMDPHFAQVTTTYLQAEIRATPDDPAAISDVTLTEVAAIVNYALPAEVNGTLDVSPAGTYGTT